ncbi:secreted RxLR effector protein 161-like [Dioscorea cayenensis subsp. rotundata]|uniref:Secreted RxLR effector protein 161-like n=1 Tax=Dioscorea cayennensis subsp. rotundata TaxID=55577 RepID=A0AB40CG73_DIOCR|nr:secreted RxLR effector protein 161-like [Dioscorea cayenensis subsp. rotundata]
MVGGLLFLTHTRPDLMFAVGLVSKFMQKPTKHHIGTVRRILHYLSGTINMGIRYDHVENFQLQGFVDSDWGGSVDDRRSTTGWVFNLGSGAVAWSSKRQEVIALSSTEAEYIAATSAACQAGWMRRLLEDLGAFSTHCTKEQLADVLTKALSGPMHEHLRGRLGVMNF